MASDYCKPVTSLMVTPGGSTENQTLGTWNKYVPTAAELSPATSESHTASIQEGTKQEEEALSK